MTAAKIFAGINAVVTRARVFMAALVLVGSAVAVSVAVAGPAFAGTG